MKILHFLGDRKLPSDPENTPTSGVTRACLEIAKAQSARGHDVTVAAVGKKGWTTYRSGIKLISLKPVSLVKLRLRGREWNFGTHLPFILLTLRRQFDVVYGHLYSYMRFIRAPVRFIYFHIDPLHKGYDGKAVGITASDHDAALRYSHGQIAVSEFVAKQLQEGFGNRGRIRVVYNGVNNTFFQPESWQKARHLLRQQWGVKGGDIVFLYVGAITPEKGVIHLAQAFAELHKRMPSVHLVVAGGSQLWGSGINPYNRHQCYENEVRETLQDAREAGRAHMLGVVGYAQLPGIYAASDTVVVPSVWHEPFCLVALEALASGKPVIASGIGGLLEVIDEKNGILVPAGDTESLQGAMKRLAEEAHLLGLLSLATQDSARNFSWEKAADELEEFCRAVLTKAS